MTAYRSQGPLAGMRVLDLSHVMAGPVCGLMLADMGADVVKIERIPVGDDSRQIMTPSIEGESAALMMMNRNKRGLALDLKKAKGQEVLRRLVRTADALIENYRKGTMEKFGLGYDALSAINPGLVYCEISGFGRTGPMASQGGFDLVTQGMSGLMSITGEGPGRPPVKVGAPVTDITAGLLACLGICAAYAHKLRTGQGQRVDTSLFEAGVAAGHGDQPVDEGLDLGGGLGAHEAVDRLAAHEGEDRRDRLHPELRRDPLVLVDVDLDQPHLALRLGDRLLQRRPQRLARPAPGRPEIDDDGDLVRGLDHVGHERRLGAVLDHVRRRLRREVQIHAKPISFARRRRRPVGRLGGAPSRCRQGESGPGPAPAGPPASRGPAAP